MSDARVSNEPLLKQLQSFNRVFWTANTIEMLERLAYYGLRTVIPIYMVLSIEQGGPEFTHVQKGLIFGWWALVQSMVPVVTGGYADRFGYKLTVAISIAIKIKECCFHIFVSTVILQRCGWFSLERIPGIEEYGPGLT